MSKLISRLAFVIVVNCYLGLAATADSSPSLITNKNFGQLNGAHLKFAVAHAPPSNVLTKEPGGNYTHTGISTLLIDWLSKKLNFKYTYFYIPNNTLEVKYGNVSEFVILFRLLTNKEVDGLAVPAIATTQRKKPWISHTSYGQILTPLWCLDEEKSLGSLPSLDHFKNQYKRVGGSVPGSRLSFRILMGAWLLAAMVLVNSYSGTVVSYLTAPKMMPSINTLDDLAASEDVGILMVDNNVMGQQIMDAKSGPLKILGDQVRRNPSRLLKNMLQVETLLETGHYALPIASYLIFYFQTFCDDFVANSFKKEGHCRFKTTDPITSSAFFSLLLQKNSKFTSEFYLAQMKAWEMGLPPYWMKINIQQAPKCFTKKRPETAKKKPIGMDD
ncbi:uncharacterized protein LOC124200581 [Daphnia pulex]|uniref:uncharacterized protein LOC124200581 n=1 Tax=Daphnia pulex TaxID=6669 RepID=UPI001EDD0925|nr:uncharacterized protein LOC124200581 [Daphnia pulex]